ncbi:MAG: DNA topoisomerase VI subunit B [Candidatus Micrarchaeota archaeon]
MRTEKNYGNRNVNAMSEAFREFRIHSVAEFFKKNRQMLGFSGRVRSMTTVIHEYVTNSLDAAEEAGVLPDITINIADLPNGHYAICSSDNSTGIPYKHMGKALAMMLAGTKFHRYMQQRGQQGIGASGCTMFSQITTGKPIHVQSGTGNGNVFECDLSIDLKTNQPKIINYKQTPGDFKGLAITAEFAEVKYDKSTHSVYEYLKMTAIANPHAQITLVEPSGEKTLFPRSTDKTPARPKEILPHPLGITTNDLVEKANHSKSRKISSFLTTEYARVSMAKIKEMDRIINDGKELGNPEYLNFEKKPSELKWAEAERLIDAIKNVKWIAPSTDSIIPIGKEHVEKSLQNILNPEFVSVTQRRPKVFRGGVPFMVEAAITYGGQSGRKTSNGTGGDIIRFANRAPLLFDGGGCAITEAVKTIDWKRYDVRDFEHEPLSVFVNFVSVYVPYTGAGKQAISPEEVIVAEIRFALMEVARDLERYIHGKVRAHERVNKIKAIKRYVKQLSVDLPELAGVGNSELLEGKLIKLIEEKYSDGLIADDGEEKEEELTNGKPEGTDDIEEEEQ